MFRRIKDNLTISFVNSMLSGYETEELNSGKRLISVIGGVYLLQKGIRALGNHTMRGIEEIALGSILLYNAASDLNKKITKKPSLPSDVRKNQIQGNDPRADVPAFV